MIKIINRHLIANFLKAIIYFNLAFVAIIIIADFTEGLRKYSSSPNFNLWYVFLLTIYKLPDLLIQVSPFIFLFASLYCFRTLVLRKEIEILKSSGLSIWQILLPLGGVSILSGIFLIVVFSTISTIFINNTSNLENAITNKKSSITYGTDNVWIIDYSNEKRQNIIKSKNLSSQDGEINLKEVSLFEFVNNKPSKISHAQHAIIKDDKLIMYDAVTKVINKPMVEVNKTLELNVNIKANRINDLSADPNSIFFWKIPLFIFTLKHASLEYASYSIYFYNLITLPISLLTMLFIGCAFSLVNSRRGKNIHIILITLVTGFIIYFFTNFLNAFGLHGTLYPALAVILGKLIVLLFSVNLIFNKEGL